MEEGGHVAPPRPPPGTIQITPEEGAAIQRVKLIYKIADEFWLQ